MHWVSFMLSVTNNPFMVSVVMLNVVMLSVIILILLASRFWGYFGLFWFRDFLGYFFKGWAFFSQKLWVTLVKPFLKLLWWKTRLKIWNLPKDVWCTQKNHKIRCKNWRHKLFPNEVILNAIIPNIKISTFWVFRDIYSEFRISILNHHYIYIMTGRASFWLTELRGKALS